VNLFSQLIFFFKWELKRAGTAPPRSPKPPSSLWILAGSFTLHPTNNNNNNNSHFTALCPDYLGEPVPEETFTHLTIGLLFQLPPSTAIRSILRVQFICSTVFLHNLSPSPLWSTSWSGTLDNILHAFFIQSLSISATRAQLIERKFWR